MTGDNAKAPVCAFPEQAEILDREGARHMRHQPSVECSRHMEGLIAAEIA
jgi:hypothetical protein